MPALAKKNENQASDMARTACQLRFVIRWVSSTA